jgi:hypothetical protein
MVERIGRAGTGSTFPTCDGAILESLIPTRTRVRTTLVACDVAADLLFEQFLEGKTNREHGAACSPIRRIQCATVLSDDPVCECEANAMSL